MDRKLEIILTAKDLTAQAFERTQGRVESLTRKVFSLQGAFTAAAAATGLGYFIQRNLEAVDALGKTADKLGVTAEALQEYRHAAELSGVSQQQLEMGLQRLGRRLGEVANFGRGEALPALEQLGFTTEELTGKYRRLEDILPEIADRISQVSDANERLSIMQKLVDSEGVGMINMLKDGSDALNRMRRDARELGLVLSDELVDGAEEANDQVTRLTSVISAQFTRAVAEVAPQIAAVTQELTESGKVQDYAESVINVAMGFLQAAFWAAEFLDKVGRGLAMAYARASGYKDSEVEIWETRIKEAEWTIDQLLQKREQLERKIQEYRSAGMAASGLDDRLEEIDAQIAAQERAVERFRKLLSEAQADAGADFQASIDRMNEAAQGTGKIGSTLGENITPPQETYETSLSEYQHYIQAMADIREKVLTQATGFGFQDRETIMHTLFGSHDTAIEISQAQQELRDSALSTAEETTRRVQRILDRARETRKREQEKHLKEMERQWDEMLRSVQGHFSDTFEDIFSGQLDSWEDLMSGMKDMFLRFLADIAAAAVVQKIVVPVLYATDGLGGLVGLPGGQGGGSNLLSGAGMARNAANLFGGGGSIFAAGSFPPASGVYTGAAGGYAGPGAASGLSSLEAGSGLSGMLSTLGLLSGAASLGWNFGTMLADVLGLGGESSRQMILPQANLGFTDKGKLTVPTYVGDLSDALNPAYEHVQLRANAYVEQLVESLPRASADAFLEALSEQEITIGAFDETVEGTSIKPLLEEYVDDMGHSVSQQMSDAIERALEAAGPGILPPETVDLTARWYGQQFGGFANLFGSITYPSGETRRWHALETYDEMDPARQQILADLTQSLTDTMNTLSRRLGVDGAWRGFEHVGFLDMSPGKSQQEIDAQVARYLAEATRKATRYMLMEEAPWMAGDQPMPLAEQRASDQGVAQSVLDMRTAYFQIDWQGEYDKILADLEFASTFREQLSALASGVAEMQQAIDASVEQEIDALVSQLQAFRETTERLNLDLDAAQEAQRKYARSLVLGRDAMGEIESAIYTVNSRYDEHIRLLEDVGYNAYEAAEIAVEAWHNAMDEIGRSISEMVAGAMQPVADEQLAEITARFDSEIAFYEDLATAWDSAARSMQNTLDGLLLGPDSPLTLMQRRTATQNRFEAGLSAAMGGDAEAAAALGGQAQDLVSAIRATTADPIEFTREFYRVTGQLREAQTAAGGRANYAEITAERLTEVRDQVEEGFASVLEAIRSGDITVEGLEDAAAQLDAYVGGVGESLTGLASSMDSIMGENIRAWSAETLGLVSSLTTAELDFLDSLTDEQREFLSGLSAEQMELLQGLDASQLEFLSTLTDEQTEFLAGLDDSQLALLEGLSDGQIDFLGSLDDAQIDFLANLSTEQVDFLKGLTDEQAGFLGNLSDEQVEFLGSLDKTQLDFLGGLTVEQVEFLSGLDRAQLDFLGNLGTEQFELLRGLDKTQLDFLGTLKIDQWEFIDGMRDKDILLLDGLSERQGELLRGLDGKQGDLLHGLLLNNNDFIGALRGDVFDEDLRTRFQDFSISTGTFSEAVGAFAEQIARLTEAEAPRMAITPEVLENMGLWNHAGGRYMGLRGSIADTAPAGILERAQDYLTRYRDIEHGSTPYWDNIFQSGTGITEDWQAALYHYYRWGYGEGRSFQGGGIATGPSSGYLAELHGTEAIIPVDGGSVPVRFVGGDSFELAEEVRRLRQEVSALREESRSTGRAITAHTHDTSRYLKRWERQGLPAERA